MLIAALLLSALSFSGASPARADATSLTGDESVSVPAAHIFYTGQTTSSITSKLGSTYRLVDLHETSTNVYSFVAVQNTGAYAVSGWWWYVGQTLSQVSNLLSTNSARLISAERMSDGTLNVIMVSNTGTAARSWWWLTGATQSQVNSLVSTNNARLVSLDQDQSASTYTAVAVSNTGTDAKSWWYYYNVSTSQVSSFLSTNGARLVDLDATGSGTWNVVMVKQTGSDNKYWKWLVGTSTTNILNTDQRTGYRVFDFQPYLSGTTTVYSAVMIDNLAPENRRVENIFESGYAASGLSGALYGYYVKPIGSGATLALSNGTKYEPASGIKALYNLYAERQVQLGNDALANTFYYWYDPANPSNAGPCPLNYSNTTSNRVTTSVSNGLSGMMFNSDNRMTQGVDLRYGRANVNSYATSIGMTGTVINQTVGCGIMNGGYVTLTLNDISKLYEGVFTNVLINSTRSGTFFARMNGGTGIASSSPFGQMVTQEANKVGKGSIVSSFLASIKYRVKGGSYDMCFATGPCSPPYNYVRSNAGIMQLPFKSAPGGSIVLRNYAYGWWVNNVKIPCAFSVNCTAKVQADSTTNKFDPEIFRAQVALALQNW